MRTRSSTDGTLLDGRTTGGQADDETATVRRSIGRNLLSLRQRAGMSLEVAGRTSGLSRSFISLVENGMSGIEVSRLIRLANAYGVLVADLLAPAQSIVRVEFVPCDAGNHVPKSARGVEVEYLGSPSWPLQPFRVRLAPGAHLAALRHPGTESIHCVEGTPTLYAGGERYDMSPGDTLILPDHTDHTYRNGGDLPAHLIGCVERLGKRTAEETPTTQRTSRAHSVTPPSMAATAK